MREAGQGGGAPGGTPYHLYMIVYYALLAAMIAVGLTLS